ncbi:MAG: hypothetical protein ACLFV7_11850 [Phycisphaerae bacterium]
MEWLSSLLSGDKKTQRGKTPLQVPKVKTPGWSVATGSNAQYIRVFSTSDRVPSVNSIIEWMGYNGLALDVLQGPANPDSTHWDIVHFSNPLTRTELRLQCTRRSDEPDCLAEMEVGEFLRRIGAAGLSGAKRRVIRALKDTKVILACKLPSGQRSQDGIAPHVQLMRFFQQRSKGLLQVDGEGFYDTGRLVLDLSNGKRK